MPPNETFLLLAGIEDDVSHQRREQRFPSQCRGGHERTGEALAGRGAYLTAQLAAGYEIHPDVIAAFERAVAEWMAEADYREKFKAWENGAPVPPMPGQSQAADDAAPVAANGEMVMLISRDGAAYVVDLPRAREMIAKDPEGWRLSGS